MNRPQMRLEIAWGYGPLDADPVFVPVDPDRPIAVSWDEGRSKGLEDYAPASATVVLANEDRLYDPEYVDGVHFGELLPGTPIRFLGYRPASDVWTAVWTDVWLGSPEARYEQFTMYVDGGWEQTFNYPAQGTCTVKLLDLIGILQGVQTPDSAYEAAVLPDTPAVLWHLDDAQGTGMKDSSGHERHGTFDEVELGQPPVITTGTSARFEHNGDWRGLFFGPAMVPSYPLTIEAWVRLSRNTAAFQCLVAGYSAAGTLRFDVSVPHTSLWSTPPGVVMLRLPSRVIAGTIHVDDETPHHIVVVLNSGSNQEIWVDGVQDTVSAPLPGTASDPFSSVVQWTVGNQRVQSAGDFGAIGDMDEVAVYDTALSSTRITAHHEAGATGWKFDKTGVRARRITDSIGVPAARRDIDDGITVLGQAELGGDAMDYVRTLARTEQGGWRTVGHDGGNLYFPDRYERFTDERSTTSQATFTDDGAVDDALRYEPPLQMEPNGRANLVNEATVNYVGGSVTRRAGTPVGGPKGVTVDTIAPDGSWAGGLGEWILARYSEPHTYVRELTILPSGLPAAWDAAMILRIGDRVTVRRKALDIGDPITSDFWIEGKHVQVSQGMKEYRVTYSLEPTFDVDWFMWDVSVWDDDTIWAY